MRWRSRTRLGLGFVFLAALSVAGCSARSSGSSPGGGAPSKIPKPSDAQRCADLAFAIDPRTGLNEVIGNPTDPDRLKLYLDDWVVASPAAERSKAVALERELIANFKRIPVADLLEIERRKEANVDSYDMFVRVLDGLTPASARFLAQTCPNPLASYWGTWL